MPISSAPSFTSFVFLTKVPRLHPRLTICEADLHRPLTIIRAASFNSLSLPTFLTRPRSHRLCTVSLSETNPLSELVQNDITTTIDLSLQLVTSRRSSITTPDRRFSAAGLPSTTGLCPKKDITCRKLSACYSRWGGSRRLRVQSMTLQ